MVSFLFVLSLLYHILRNLQRLNDGNFSERSARKRVLLPIVLSKRSGRPEQWPKRGEKYDLIRKIQPFLGNLERFGEIWIPIWIRC